MAAFTQSDIDALRAKIQSFAGVRSTAISDQSTVFSMDDALRLLERMEREVNGTTRTRYAIVNKGFGSATSEEE